MLLAWFAQAHLQIHQTGHDDAAAGIDNGVRRKVRRYIFDSCYRSSDEGYFNPSSVIRNSAKHGVKALYELPKIKKKYAAFLEEQASDSMKFFLNDKASSLYQEGHR